MSEMPTVETLRLKTHKTKMGFIPGRFPYTYAYDFVREFPSILPEMIHEILTDVTFSYMSRHDAAVAVREWAAMEDWDVEMLCSRMAVAYCKYYDIDIPEDILDSV